MKDLHVSWPLAPKKSTKNLFESIFVCLSVVTRSRKRFNRFRWFSKCRIFMKTHRAKNGFSIASLVIFCGSFVAHLSNSFYSLLLGQFCSYLLIACDVLDKINVLSAIVILISPWKNGRRQPFCYIYFTSNIDFWTNFFCKWWVGASGIFYWIPESFHNPWSSLKSYGSRSIKGPLEVNSLYFLWKIHWICERSS